LEVVIEAFQNRYPEINFDITIVPQADLRARYEYEAYLGGGPALLLAPGEWGPAFYANQLVSDLTPYTSREFTERINPAALGTGMFDGALISLPVFERGIVLYRNTLLVPSAPETFAELISLSQAATRGGRLGAYFDRGAFYSAGNIAGLGGSLMNADQTPAFNSPAGYTWLNLLADYDVAGAIGLNTNRDLDLFRSGRIGFIIEGTWQIPSLEAALGADNFAIDPWPAYGDGRMSGFVQSEAVYLNPNTSPANQAAAMLFMGFLLTADVQQYLAEFGMIPSVLDAQPRPIHVAEAAVALEAGTAYPPVQDVHVINAYWEGLELAIQQRFTYRRDPQVALQMAQDRINELLALLTPLP
jgi:multiple sugar transport system substrate-binding protein